MLPMRVLRHAKVMAIAMLTLCVTAAPADAAWKPQKVVEIIVGAQAAGANDRAGRMLQKILTDSNLVAVPLQVMNKPGQGQALAIAYLNAHAGDPHYLMILGSSWVTTAIHTNSTISYRDLTPITKLYDTDLVIYVAADSPHRSLKDVSDALVKGAAPVSFAFSTSAGNVSHIALAEIARIAGYDARKLRLVVNASGSITATQVAGGHVSVGISSSGSAQAMSSAGKIRLIGAIANQRLPQLTEVPTLREQGFDVVASTWFTVFGPKGLTPAQVAYWEGTIGKAMRLPEAKKFADTNNWSIELTGSKDLLAQLDKEYAKLKKTLVELGMVQ